MIILLLLIAVYLLYRNYFGLFRIRWREPFISYIGRILLCLPFIRKIYQNKMDEVHQESLKKIQNQLEIYGDTITEIPETGWEDSQLVGLVDRYHDITLKNVQNKKLSGTIYTNALLKDDSTKLVAESDTDFSQRQNKIFTYAFSKSYLWNSLHQEEFSIGTFLDYQIVQMVGNLFGESNVMGLITTGGTGSIMTAMRCYRNYGMKTKGHQPGDGVIVAPDTVHAAFMKAADAYLLELVLVKTNAYGEFDIDLFEQTVQSKGSRLVAIVGSAPAYSTGQVDPIKLLADLAIKYNCGLHVDCCLGGFVINYVDGLDSQFLKINGVTSVSCDLHKNGLSAKGSSVLLTKQLGDYNLAYHSIYTVPDWHGGIYGSVSDPGSMQCTSSLNALLAMLMTGNSLYKSISKQIQSTTAELSDTIKKNGDLMLLNRSNINVVAFKIAPESDLSSLAIYLIAKKMAEQDVILNILNHETVHFCVTWRFAADPANVSVFSDALVKAIAYARDNPDTNIVNNSMYCSIDCAINPTKSLNKKSFVENLLWGHMGMHDGIRMHFLALLDPFKKLNY